MARIPRFIRTYPILFGALITVITFPLLIIFVTSHPSLERFFGENQAWFPFAIFTATTFSVLVIRFRPRRTQAKYWTIAAGMFLLHMACFITYMRYFRPLAPIDYILYGPLEWFAVGLILYRSSKIRASAEHS